MAHMTDNSPRRRRRHGIAGAGLAVLFIGGLVAGCTVVPQTTVSIPFTYTAEFRPTIDYPSGSVFTVLVVCLDEPSAVRIESAGSARLEWSSGAWATDYSVREVVTPVLQPGCGTLHIGPIFGHASWPVTVTVSKV